MIQATVAGAPAPPGRYPPCADWWFQPDVLKAQASSIKHQASGIKHPASSIQHQASGIKHQARAYWPMISWLCRDGCTSDASHAFVHCSFCLRVVGGSWTVGHCLHRQGISAAVVGQQGSALLTFILLFLSWSASGAGHWRCLLCAGVWWPAGPALAGRCPRGLAGHDRWGWGGELGSVSWCWCQILILILPHFCCRLHDRASPRIKPGCLLLPRHVSCANASSILLVAPSSSSSR